MIWFAAALGIVALALAYLLVYLWTLRTSEEDLERLEERDLAGRWVWERLSAREHLLLSQRRTYCRLYARSMLPELEADMRSLAKVCGRPVLAAGALMAFKLLTAAIRIKIRLAAGREDLRGAVAFQVLFLRWMLTGNRPADQQ